jgi:ribosomal protein S18 acetylase RimI-like enzyme
MLLVEHSDRIIGLCNAINKEEYNELQVIYILPEYQRLGLGRALWEEAKNIFDSQKDIIVHVASYNNKAINFYEKLGFVSTGKIFFDEKHRMRNGAIIPELEMIIKKKI